MAEMSRRFNFDEFDHLIAEALEEDEQMATEDADREEAEKWADYDRVFGPHPGQIGGAAVRLSELPDPPEAA